MMYLVTNIFLNRNVYNMEFRNDKLETIFIKSNANAFDLEIGDFVEVECVSKKNKVVDKVQTPENFLDYYFKGQSTYEQLYSKIKSYYDRMDSDVYKIILDETIFTNLNFFKYPAAKNIHHAHIGGLAEHTINMLKLSEVFIELYNLDRDLLWSGIILHDYCKIEELTHYGLTYSVKGNLLGHLVMGVEEITRICMKEGIEEGIEVTLLKHLIISHHGRLDYGSPKEPMTYEAYILSELDEIDAKMNVLNKAFKDVDNKSITPPIMAFDRRRFYKHEKGTE